MGGMKLTNTYSSGSLHRRVRRMLILCIAVVVLLATSVGLGISLHQEVRTRDQLLSNAAQMAADAPLLTDTIQTDTAQQYLERTVRRVAAVDMLGIYDVQGRPLVFYDLAAGEGEASVLPILRADTVRRLYSEQKPLLSSDEMPEGADRCAYAVVRDENGQAFGIVMALCESGLADSYIKGIMMTACIAIIMTTSLNLTIGVLGQLTLGCCGFEAIGAYSAALLSKLLVANGVAMDPTLRFLLTTLAGGVVACIFGILVGIPALRLHGDYLAIITLGFGEIIRVIIQNLKVAGGMGLDKGAAGQALIGIDRLANLYVVFWITVVTVVLLFMFARSRYGRAVKAIRDDEIAASASGINITYMKVLVFAISAFFAGIAGGIFAQYIGSLNPAMAGWLQSINYVIMVVFGGMGSLTGSIVSAIALTILPELLRAFSTYRMLVYSVALVLIMIFRPQGIFGNWEFSLTKTINKLFYPMKVKAHGKSKQAESTAKAAKDTAKTDETVETAADTKEAQA